MCVYMYMLCLNLNHLLEQLCGDNFLGAILACKIMRIKQYITQILKIVHI